jgi:hypothetical protein
MSDSGAKRDFCPDAHVELEITEETVVAHPLFANTETSLLFRNFQRQIPIQFFAHCSEDDT